jgi:ElaB/YqjD/DUF883 family membrane-anchored ribosome-binding protein
MAEGTEPIREEIAALRDSMSATVAQIESQVRTTLDEKVEQVHRVTDLRHLIADHPWQAMGLAVAVGYLIGRR